MGMRFKPYKQPNFPQTPNPGDAALKQINSTPQTFTQAEGIAKAPSYPENNIGTERLENKFKALKSALTRSTAGKPTR